MSNMYSIKKGEKFPIHIKLNNRELCEPIDLTGATIKFQLKDELDDELFIIEKEITESTDVNTIGQIVAPLNGELVVRLTDEDYSKLVINRVYYLTLWWENTEKNFAKVISSNGCETLKFMVCHP